MTFFDIIKSITDQNNVSFLYVNNTYYIIQTKTLVTAFKDRVSTLVIQSRRNAFAQLVFNSPKTDKVAKVFITSC